MKEKPKIIKEMTIEEVISRYPETAPAFIDFGFHCFSCSLVGSETIEQSAKFHRINLQKFLQQLNEKADIRVSSKK